MQIVNFEKAGGWTVEETKALLGIWGDSTVQSQLDKVVRNKTIYIKIAKELEDMGFDHMWEQCRTKVKNLVKAYRKVKDNNNISGRGRKSTPFYDELDAILGTRAVSRLPVLLDSGGNAIPREEDIAAVLEVDPDTDEEVIEATVVAEDDNINSPVPTDASSSSSSSSSDTPAPNTTTNSSNSSSSPANGSDSPIRTKHKHMDLRKCGMKRKQQELTGAEMLEKIFEKAEERTAERELKLRKLELEFEERWREREDQRDQNM